jgi:hypothetical protein
MESGKSSVIYMWLVPGPNKADNMCGKTKVTGAMQRGSTLQYLPENKMWIVFSLFHIDN